MMYKLYQVIVTFAILFIAQPNMSLASSESNTQGMKIPILLSVSTKNHTSQSVYSLLVTHADTLQLSGLVDSLTFYKQKESLAAHHFHYLQRVNGIPVYGKEVIVSINKHAPKQAKVFVHIAKNIHSVTVSAPQVSEYQAMENSWQELQSSGALLSSPSANLFYVPFNNELTLAYVTRMAVSEPFGEWQQIIHAVTGESLSLKRIDLPTFDNANADIKKSVQKNEKQQALSDVFNPFSQAIKKQQEVVAQKTVQAVTTDASARVFDPDPRTQLMDNSLRDTSPLEDFTAAYVTRPLKDITLEDGVYHLKGPWVTIKDLEVGDATAAEAPSTSTTGVWAHTRGDNAFDDANTYFHIDQSQRYLQSLGFTGSTGIQFNSIAVDTNGAFAADNAYYFPGSNQIVLGHGCVNAGEDADTILHEYGHAIHSAINSQWFGGDTGAIGEGFSDYWAGSYSVSTTNGALFDVNKVFNWDGNEHCWGGRFMNRTHYTYDPTQTYEAHRFVNGQMSDELWSTPLFQSLLMLIEQGHTREEVDQIILEAQFGLGSGITMPQMAVSIVQTAQTLFPGGPHAQVFDRNFKQVGILDAAIKAEEMIIRDVGDNALIDPGEKPQLNLPLSNISAFDLTDISVQFASTTAGVTVVDTTAAYPDIAAGVTANNLSPVTMTVSRELACGTPISISAHVTFTENQIRHSESFEQLLFTGARSQVSQSATSDLTIPDDDDKGITSTVVLENAGNVIDQNFTVDVDISHTYRGDLRLVLISPQGTAVTLAEPNYDSADDMVGRFPDTLSMVGDFSDFQGESLNGTWTLSVVDTVGFDVGVLNSWRLSVGGDAVCEEPPPNSAPVLIVAQPSELTIDEGALVTLDASATTDPDGDTIQFSWEQLSGPQIALSANQSDQLRFTAPFVDAMTSLMFKVTASDEQNAQTSSVITVIVKDVEPLATESRTSADNQQSVSTNTVAASNNSRSRSGGGSMGFWSLLLCLLWMKPKHIRALM